MAKSSKKPAAKKMNAPPPGKARSRKKPAVKTHDQQHEDDMDLAKRDADFINAGSTIESNDGKTVPCAADESE